MLRTIATLILLITMTISPVLAQDVIDKGKITVLMTDGRHKMNEFDYKGAMVQFKEVLKLDENHAMAHFRISECHLRIRNYKYAQEYAAKARELDPEVDKELDYIEGQVLFKLGDIDKAESLFTRYKERLGDAALKESLVGRYLEDCAFARKAMADSADVEVMMLENNISSTFRDYAPVLSPDGKYLYFTSRRSDTKGGGIAGDYVYFEDVYVCEWDSVNNTWGEPDHMPGKLNSESHESVSSISADGSEMYVTVYTSDSKLTDIAVCRSRGDKPEDWGSPKLLPKRTINTSFFETSGSVPESGTVMYFISDRKTTIGSKTDNSLGRGDIFLAKREGRKGWAKPVNVGSHINTIDDENSVYVTPDGKYLFFSSNGLPGVGGYDIFVCKSVGDNEWSKPVNLGYPINSVDDETHFKPDPKMRYAYYTSIRPGGAGQHDIYYADLSNLDLEALFK